MLALVAYLTIFSASDAVRCPEPNPWPRNLPEPVRADCGTCLPGILAEAVWERLRYLDAYPSICQTAVNARSAICYEEIKQAVRVAEADALAARVEARWPTGWTWWQVAVAIVASSATSAAIAIVLTRGD